MKNTIYCVAFLLVGLAVVAPLFANDADIALLMARTCLRDGKAELALGWLEGEDKASKELKFYRGVALYQMGKSGQGFALMENNYEAAAATAEQHSYMALAHFTEERYQAALETLALVDKDEDLALTFPNLLLNGQIQLALGNRKEAFAALRNVKNIGPEKLAARAEEVLAEAQFSNEEIMSWGYEQRQRKRRTKKRSKKPSFRVSLGLEMATNVSGLPVANEESPPLGVDDAQDLSVSLRINGQIPMKRQGDSVRVSVDRRSPIDLSEFAQDVLHAEYSSSSKKGKARFTKAAYLGTSLLDGAESMHYLGALFDYSVSKSMNQRWRVTYTLRNEDHDEPNFPQEDRTGNTHTLSYTHYLKFGKKPERGRDNRDEWGIGVNIRTADLDGDVYSLNGYGPRLEWKKRLAGRKSVSLRYLYWANDYDGPPVPMGPMPPGPKREDWRNQVDVRFTAPLHAKTEFWSRLGYSRNRSNVPFQDRKNLTIAAGMTWKF